MRKIFMIFFVVVLIVIFFAPFANGAKSDFDSVANKLIKKLEGKVERAEIEKIFSDPRITLHPELLKKLGKKGKKFSYFSEEFGMFNFVSVSRGKKLLEDRSDVFAKVEKEYSVEREVLTSIFRIETNFGEFLGNYRVFNVLLTFATLENRRSEWAKQELASLFLLSMRNRLDILEIRGSWAGAFGFTQFIPSSFLAFAVDGNGDKRVDLFCLEDAIASAANYLRRHGWNGDIERKKKALFAYNRSDEYGRAVLAYAARIK